MLRDCDINFVVDFDDAVRFLDMVEAIEFKAIGEKISACPAVSS